MKLLPFALILATVAAPASALAVGPRYQAPVVPPVVLLNAAPEAVTGGQPEAAWWRAFEDPVLDRLIERALIGNPGLRMAVDRVHEARALFRDSSLDQLPRITSRADYSRSDEQTPGFGSSRNLLESADIGFDAAWEIDLFGRVRHGVEAAKAQAEAALADSRNAQVTVAAEVARNYFELRGAQSRLAVAQLNAAAQRETLRLTEVRFNVGNGDPVDVDSARARLSATANRLWAPRSSK